MIAAAARTPGHRCTTLRRPIAHEPISKALAKRLAKAHARLQIGDPRQPGGLAGPPIGRAAFGSMDRGLQDPAGPGGERVCGGPRVTTTSYAYFANFAIGLCEGPIAGIGRMWVDGKQLDLSQYTYRIHRGDDEQLPDPLIAAKEAEGEAPRYRGPAHPLFARLTTDTRGDRPPPHV